MQLSFNLSFHDLYDDEALTKVDQAFADYVKQEHVELFNRFMAARAEPTILAQKDESNLLIELAPYLESFIAKLFLIEKEVAALRGEHKALDDLYACKRLFVQRRAVKLVKPEEVSTIDHLSLTRQLEEIFGEAVTELSFARHVMQWLDEKGADKPEFVSKSAIAGQYAAWAVHTHAYPDGVLFKVPKKLDNEHLVPAVETHVLDGVTMLKFSDHHLRVRDGFKLTDAGGSLEQALDDANYCIYCHNQGKDSCSKGMREKDGVFKRNPLDILLAGCPLEEKISEMNTLKAAGYTIGALGIVTVDNPMCAGTGHRICNDCMKSCIYQKQEPVNIPRTETRSLQDVLELPYGFEIYSLLTRWNPLNLRRPLPKPETGYKVLVSGLGPAGFTLSHHLLNDGHTVVAIDGLKIEPLPDVLAGGNFEPVKDISQLFESLDERVLAGFGGVAEYGITVRWNKNYLKVIRLLLERRARFALFGGVRFGGTITYASAWKLGFDHIALCMGAGKPTVIDMPNSLARGVRTASDFLMSLQLTGAAKKTSIANLQLRLPVVVIGGGLTAIDTATESLAYYPIQVEKFLTRYEALAKEKGEAAVRKNWSAEETIVAEEFISHAKALRQATGKDRIKLLQSWGGSKVAYRKRLQDSPAYRLNHEEVEKALEEGIDFIENVTPMGVELDEFGHAKALKTGNGIIPARNIFMAAGTSPNTILAREDAEHFTLDGKWFSAIDEAGERVTPPANLSKPHTPFVLMNEDQEHRCVSFFGDLHPSFVGNVVKAMGSAKQGYPVVSRVLSRRAATKDTSFLSSIASQLEVRVHEIVRLTPTIIEVVLKAPLAAKEFQPGQFYRLQNYETLATNVNGTTLAMEGLALTGAWVDKEKGLISVIVLEMGGSSDLCAHLKKDERVVLMGPTGAPTHIEANETVLLAGGGLGNAVLFSIGRAFKARGSKVLYFAGYKKAVDRYKIEEIEASSDIVVWCCDEERLEGERSFHGNIVQAMVNYAEGKLGEPSLPLSNVDRIIAIGSDRMMAAVASARHTTLKPYLKPKHEALGSINSPMQCMMKEICAQCLQEHIDPVTGAKSYVYSCFNQDQELDRVSWPHLNERLKQNGVQEKLTAQWIDSCLKQLNLRQAVAA